MKSRIEEIYESTTEVFNDKLNRPLEKVYEALENKDTKTAEEMAKEYTKNASNIFKYFNV